MSKHTLSKNFDPSEQLDSLAAAEARLAEITAAADQEPLTVLIHDEHGHVAKFFSNKRITGELTKEGFACNGSTIIDLETVDFDATSAVLMMAFVDLIGPEGDALCAIGKVCVDWDGPFSVEHLRESICEFFAINEIEDLTQDCFDAAVLAIGGGLVEEVITLTVQIKVSRLAETDLNAFIENLDYTVKSNTAGVQVIGTEITAAD